MFKTFLKSPKFIMLVLFLCIVYSLVVGAVFCVCLKHNKHTHALPQLQLKRWGIQFNSFCRHKIFVGQASMLKIGNNVFLKQNGKVVSISNIANPNLINNYFYFTAKGQVKMEFDCHLFYRYFNVKISSQMFNLFWLKRKALLEIVNNIFNLNACVNAKRYIGIIKNILNITANSNKIVVKKNKYNIPFTLTYKANGKIKKVYVNTIE